MDETKYKGRYRIPSARAWWHQYNGGSYYVTICTKNRENYFGRIEDGVMEMSEIGKCLNEQILLTSEMRADMNVEIPLFSIMPNHVHLIVIIGENVFNTPVEYDGAVGDGSCCRDAMLCVSENGNAFSPQSKNLASIIRGIKIGTKAYATNNNIEFDWQPRFHDHIIRNVDELNAIAKYIEDNVANWKEDDFYRG